MRGAALGSAGGRQDARGHLGEAPWRFDEYWESCQCQCLHVISPFLSLSSPGQAERPATAVPREDVLPLKMCVLILSVSSLKCCAVPASSRMASDSEHHGIMACLTLCWCFFSLQVSLIVRNRFWCWFVCSVCSVLLTTFCPVICTRPTLPTCKNKAISPAQIGGKVRARNNKRNKRVRGASWMNKRGSASFTSEYHDSMPGESYM